MSASETNLYLFNDGAYQGQDPQGGSPHDLVTDGHGNLFGTTAYGGAYGDGTLFEINSAGALTVLVNFNGSNGGELIVDASGDLFGATENGGAYGDGSVFELAKTASGYASTPTTLVSFNETNGTAPLRSLFFDANGDLFGTAYNSGTDNLGTVFEIVKTANGYAGASTTLVNFDGSSGVFPADLIADANGDLFGVDVGIGSNYGNQVFELAKTSNGYATTPTVLFSLPIGGNLGNLVTDANGDLFGTTDNSGGTVFEIAKTASGYVESTLVSFNEVQGYSSSPTGLIVDGAGDLFGTTAVGGANESGSVFEIAKTASGYASTPITVFSFNVFATGSGYTGLGPESLIADAAGNLFGVTDGFSAFYLGTVFEITGSGFVPIATPKITGASAGSGFGNVTLNGTTIDAGSTISIYDGTALVGTTTANAYGTWSFNLSLASGVNSLTALEGMGISSVFTADFVSSGTTFVSAPSSVSYLVEGTGVLNVVSGGTIAGAIVADGGTENDGGVANGTSVLDGGAEIVSGTSNGTVVASGGGQIVLNGGAAQGTTVLSGGFQQVVNATVTGTALSGNEQILNGGVATNTTVDNGGAQVVASGGTANGTMIDSGGSVYVGAGGTTNGMTVDSGSVAQIDTGATDSHSVVFGYQYVAGSATGTTIQNGGIQDDKGSVSGAVVADGGTQSVSNGGSATGTTVEAGGFQMVNAGTLTDTNLYGSQQVLAGGTAIGTTIEAGGGEYVGSGGRTIGTVTDSNGRQYVATGAIDSSSIVSGGYQYVAGTATGTTITAGGDQDVGAGGVAVSSSLVSGTMDVLTGGMANGVDFGGSSPAVLVLNDPSAFTGTVANFGAGDRLDFRDVTSASVVNGDVTMTTAGGGNYSWALMGQYAAGDIGFTGDGFGGTMLTYNPADTTHTINLAPAAHA